ATKKITLTNNTDLTVYPILRDANSKQDLEAGAPPNTGLYDPFDPLNQEYRGYIGYKDPATGRFYLGLRPGMSITIQVPLVFWDAGRLYITTDGTDLIPRACGPNPFLYYDINPFDQQPTARFMQDNNADVTDGSLGRVLWYHARSAGPGFAEDVGP